MDFKQTSTSKIPKAPQMKKNPMQDFMNMAQGGIGFLPLLPKKIKVFIGLALFFLGFGVISFIVCVVRLLQAYPIYTFIGIGIVTILLFLFLKKSKKNETKK